VPPGLATLSQRRAIYVAKPCKLIGYSSE